MGKEARSFSIDEDVNKILGEREDMNPSAAVNKFLREYLMAGRGEEAALAVRLEQLDDEIADLRSELQRKERERENISNRLDDRRSALQDVVDEVEQKIRDGKFPKENVDVDNAAIQRWAAEAGVPAERFVSELESRL